MFLLWKTLYWKQKHADRKNFEIVSTINTKIYTSTLEICRGRENNYAKNIERRLLGISNFVATEAWYHSACRSSFESPLPKKSLKSCPISTDKIAAFESICIILEDEIELFTLSEFQAKMEEQQENVYSPLMMKKEWQEKYWEEINFLSRNGKLDIIIPSNISSTLTVAWYNKRRVSKADEAERVIKTASKLIKYAFKNHTHETDFYPTAGDIKNTENEFVPLALQTLKSPAKQNYLSRAIFAASRTRSYVLAIWTSCCCRQPNVIEVA